MQRIGIFGGTFDPVHLGHLIIAEQCREQGRLDEVWFVPAARPPHKQDRSRTPFAQRVEMLRLATAGQPTFHIEELEADRPGPSYTADTLAECHRRRPGAEWELILGSDSLRDLSRWYEPARIVEMAGLLVWERPGAPVPSQAELHAGLRLPDAMRLRCQVLSEPLIGISSSDLRRRVAGGQTIRYLVPRAVECYIHEKHLYELPA
jgi:nicotinate-nucleotide adenylyltransferase